MSPEAHLRSVPDPVRARIDGAHHPVIVVGGGQAGLSTSRVLTDRGIDHLVLEAETAGHEWADRRWDSFCLVTPNWQCALPGFAYDGPEPDGFMVRDEITQYLEKFVASFAPPLVEGVRATSLRAREGRFEIATDRGTATADQVVIATGPYQVPRTPRMAERLPDSVVQVHSSEYRNPDQLPAGPVLVVGTGQSGCQIAEDLHLAGREVHLATGTAPRVARFYRGRDCVAWLSDMGTYTKGIDAFPDVEAVRHKTNHYVTGRDGGRDIDLRKFALEGMRLHGRLHRIDPDVVHFGPELRANLDGADAVAEGIKDSIDAYIEANGIDAPVEERKAPVWAPAEDAPSELAVSEIAAVVWATGYGRDDRWIELPIFDGRGYPTHERGVTSQPGLYFIGLPWQYTWGSGRFSGVAADAEYLVDRIAETRRGTVADGLHWLAGTPSSTFPSDDDWVAPRSAS
ncbi:MSMEG_0569 family flavin-dependent oxidoreductase [Pseudonocardia sp. WMMC193]|uniref:MSMEG_0569 family flavin-dependent oxidoreductase n=1 Tax=Pseudonocardia sp. WMMC193 TaxID=2911965 RepID=UPI001F3EFA55|nr:MSMEG_0569 family flavin-dependent oxidoreductase [Pseudonocardia sp. WMMC193]MCF7552787.1 MSMEG_0569 family flavin-dependent oxidoreductase [Pseudonocardia sp. WMMC193]